VAGWYPARVVRHARARGLKTSRTWPGVPAEGNSHATTPRRGGTATPPAAHCWRSSQAIAAAACQELAVVLLRLAA